MHGSKKGIDPNLTPEWLVKKAQRISRKYKDREKGDNFSRTKKPNCRSS